MRNIKLYPMVGGFAENKDLARKIRLENIIPELEEGREVALDFDGVNTATQSFIHALLSDLIRKYGIEVLDMLYFKNCNETVRNIITMVTDYMQEVE